MWSRVASVAAQCSGVLPRRRAMHVRADLETRQLVVCGLWLSADVRMCSRLAVHSG